MDCESAENDAFPHLAENGKSAQVGEHADEERPLIGYNEPTA